MASKREPSPSLRMRKIALVICEGETEVCYINLVQAINEKLQKCKAEMLLSNPCFEIWLLLHAKDQKSAIETDALIKELKKSAPVWKNYSKSAFTDTQKAFLNDNTDVAVARAKDLCEFQNPSTGIYKLIDLLQKNAKMVNH